MLYFITGNKDKLREAQEILGEVEGIELDLPEIQEIDAQKIIKAKLQAAMAHRAGEFIVEDSSLCFEALNGLPGPLIKWFEKALGNQGLYNLVAKLGDTKAQAKVVIGYAKNKNKIKFFEGVIEGEIVSPRGKHGFGWDAIFQPKGCKKAFAEMDPAEKNSLSMRKMALEGVKEYLRLQI